MSRFPIRFLEENGHCVMFVRESNSALPSICGTPCDDVVRSLRHSHQSISDSWWKTLSAFSLISRLSFLSESGLVHRSVQMYEQVQIEQFLLPCHRTHVGLELAPGTFGPWLMASLAGSKSLSQEWGSLENSCSQSCLELQVWPDILAANLKRSCLSLWGFSVHKAAAIWLWKTPAETQEKIENTQAHLLGLIALLLLSTSGTLGINCWPLFNFLNCKNYGPKVQWIGRGELLCLWASFPISIKSTNKSNISIYTSWGLCIREAKHVPASLRRWLHGQICAQVMWRSLPNWARGNNQSRWTRDIKNNTRNFIRERAPAQTGFVWFSFCSWVTNVY